MHDQVTAVTMKSSGVKVVFDHASDTWDIHVPAKYSGKTEGLCGLADGEISNDLWIGTYAVASVSAKVAVSANIIGTFFNHWLSRNHASGSGLATAELPECLVDAAAETGLIGGGGSALAHTFCSQLFAKDLFSEVAKVVDTKEYIDTCVRTTAGSPVLHIGANIPSDWPGCSVFAAFVEAGSRLGKCVSWRSDKFCAYSSCSGNGCHYQACGPSTQKTCDNFKTYHSLKVSLNTEGCFCSAGKVVFFSHMKQQKVTNV